MGVGEVALGVGEVPLGVGEVALGVGGSNAVRVERGRGTEGEVAGRTPTRGRLAGAARAAAVGGVEGAGGGGGVAPDK